ncbi:MAG TPA: hypothetical protein VGO93_31410 [Candidatus Xenobia bacterium]
MFALSFRLLYLAEDAPPTETARAKNDARFELLSATGAARSAIEAWERGAAARCSWELAGFDEAVADAQERLEADDVGELSTRLEAAVRWFQRAQSEAAASRGPTGLALVNLMVHGTATGAAAAELAAACAEAAGAWRALGEAARDVADGKRRDLDAVLQAAEAVEKQRAGQWTRWPALNDVLRGRGDVAGLLRQFSAMSAVVQKEVPDVAAPLKRVEGLLRELSQGGTDAALIRRLTVALDDLEEVQARLDRAVPPAPMVATSSEIEAVKAAAIAYATGQGSVETFSEAIGAFHVKIEEARAAPEGVNADRYQAGLDKLHQAIAAWSLLLAGNPQALEDGNRHAEAGLQDLLASADQPFSSNSAP